MFWLVSEKGQRRPFCPDDEWAGLTGHFSFSPSLSLSHCLSFLPSILSTSSSISIHLPTRSHNLFPPTWGPETDSTRWQIYRRRHEVKRLKLSVTPGDPLPGGGEIEAPFISAEVPVKGSSYISPQQGLCLHFSENCSHFPIQLESWNFLIP